MSIYLFLCELLRWGLGVKIARFKGPFDFCMIKFTLENNSYLYNLNPVILLSGDTMRIGFFVSLSVFLSFLNLSFTSAMEKENKSNVLIKKTVKKPQFNLKTAAIYGDEEHLKLAVKHGVISKINNYDKDGMTPLLWACSSNEENKHASSVSYKPKVEKIALMLDCGANPNKVDNKNNKGRSPFRWLLRMHENSTEKSKAKKETTSELLSSFFLLMCHGANPHIIDAYGHSVIDWVECQGFTEEVKSLFGSIFAINENTSQKEKEALLFAIYSFQKDEFLKAKNEDTANKRDLSWEKCRAELIKNSFVCTEKPLPFDNCAMQISFKNIYKPYITHTPLDNLVITLNYACIDKNIDDVKIILRTADPSILMKKFICMTPLYEAARNGHVEIVNEIIATAGKNAFNVISAMHGDNNMDICSSILCWPVWSGFTDVIKIILTAAGNKAFDLISLKDRMGSSPWFLALNRNNPKIIKMFLDTAGRKKACKLICSRDEWYQEGNSIHKAAGMASEEILNLLIEKVGKDIGKIMLSQDCYGETALHKIAQYEIRKEDDCEKCIAVANLLIKAAGPYAQKLLSMKDEFGYTASDRAQSKHQRNSLYKKIGSTISDLATKHYEELAQILKPAQ